MSEQNVELHRRLYASFNADDIETFIELFDPQIEFHSRFVALGGVTVYRGHDGLRSWNQGYEEVWGGERHIEVEAYFDLGDQTLARAVLYARGRQSGAETTMQLAQVAGWRDDLCVYLRSYTDLKDALSDLGATEAELKPIDP
jgi:ketosteroid isomerase-like protein